MMISHQISFTKQSKHEPEELERMERHDESGESETDKSSLEFIRFRVNSAA